MSGTSIIAQSFRSLMSGIQVQQLELPIEFVLIVYMGTYRAVEKMEPLPLENHKLLCVS